MSNKITLKRLAEFIWSLENEFDLLNYSVDGIKIWQYYRFRIFNTLAKRSGIYSEAHSKKTSFIELLKASPFLFYYTIFSNPLKGSYTKDILIFNSGRKYRIDNQNVDIYIDYFLNSEELENYEIIDELYENKHTPVRNKFIKHQDYQQISTYVKKKFSRFTFNKKQKLFINSIEKKIYSELSIEINLIDLLRSGYLLFKYDYQFFNKLLQKRKPQKIYIVCSYTYKKSLVAAAKNNGIECIELQHGTITKYHMGYSYPNSSYIDYFPDKLLVFGQFWKDALSFPISDDNIIVKGFPYFNIQKNRFINSKKNKNQILIISQGSIGKKLSNLVFEGADLLKNYQIIYKLHPGEYTRWETEYPDLIKLSSYENFQILDNNRINLYSLFASSEYVIGVYSTAVYEALALGCNVVLINLPGIEYMSEIIDNKNAKLANNISEATECFINKKFKKIPSNYIFG